MVRVGAMQRLSGDLGASADDFRRTHAAVGEIWGDVRVGVFRCGFADQS